MKIAVLCFAHKDSYLLNTLFAQLLSLNDTTDIYVHLDKKSEKLKSEIIESDHVRYIKNNVSVTWGDDSMMRSFINSMNEINEQKISYDHFIICTGQDLLVKDGLVDFLKQNKDNIYLDAYKGRDSFYRLVLTHSFPRTICRDLYIYPWYHPLRLYLSIYFRLVSRGLIPKKKDICGTKDLTFYYSFNWSVMPYKVMEYIVNYLKENPKFQNLYSNTYIPEDGFLATIILNSPFAQNVQWEDDVHSKTLTYHTPIKIHPKVFDLTDVKDIEESGCYFARKFDSNVDKKIIDYCKNLIIK